MAIKKGVSTSDKGTYIPEDKREPYDPENLRLSKAQFVEKQRLRKEKAAKLEEVAKQIDKEQKTKKVA